MSKRLSKMGWIVLITLLCLALVALPACTAPTGEEEEEQQGAVPYKNDGMFVEMAIGDPETLDPAAAYDTSAGEIISYVYEYLVMYDSTKSDQFVPALATDWTWNQADATWTFTIRQNVKFQNGDLLTPADVEYSFERGMIYDRAGGPQWMMFEPLANCDEYDQTTWDVVDKSVEVNGNTVVFKMVDPSWKLIFLQTIANSWGAILDKNWCIANGEWNGTEADIANHHQQKDGTTYLWTHMNGTGPWKLNVWDQGVQWKLEKNTTYWGKAAPFDWVVMQLVTEWTTRKAALLAGDADYVDVPRMYIHELDNISDLNVITGLPQLVVEGFFFVLNISSTSSYIGSGKLDGNGIPGDFFTDEDVRKGMCYAFNYDQFLTQAMMGEAIQPGSPIVQGLYGFNPNASMYTYDLTKAADHFKAAWGGQVWDKGFKFTMLYNAGNEARKTACEILTNNLYAINKKFQVAIQPLDWRTGILPLIKTKLATVYCIGWSADYPHAHDFVVPFMMSTGVFAKYQSYGNAALDAQIMAALMEPDSAKQLQDYYAVAEKFYNDAPGFMLDQPVGRRYFTKYIHGFYYNPMIPGNAGPLYYMTKSQS
jgi:peptide/nickel transport system substrate-binding protein